MSRLCKAVILGLLTGILGLVVSFIPFVLVLEENVGLDLLFKLRGVRQAPSDVIIVSIDKVSADSLSLPDDPRKWPRSLHARLTENLVKEGAVVIAFDISLDEARSAKEDNLFAGAISKARNVVLCECIRSEKVPLTDNEGFPKGTLYIERLVPPIPLFAQFAAALAPFPLPKVPVKVSQYWTFKTAAGDTPTLPVVAFQIFTLEVYDEFIRLLEKINPYQAQKLPRDKNEIITTKSVERSIRDIREIFEKEPLTAERMFEELQSSKTLSVDVRKHQLLKLLIRMYQSAHSQYLNFYGPPGTVITVPYYQVLQLKERTAGNKQIDVKGKAVFIGLSERFRPEQKDGFYTVFSQPDGLDISGVEIAATAFANLLEDMPVKPLGSLTHLTIIFLWGVVIGIFCRLFPTGIAAFSAIGLGILYLMAAEHQFKTAGIWYPVVLPLFLQTSLAFFGAVCGSILTRLRSVRISERLLDTFCPIMLLNSYQKILQISKQVNNLSMEFVYLQMQNSTLL